MEVVRSLSLSKVWSLFIAFSIFCVSLKAEPAVPPSSQPAKNIRFVLEVYTLKKSDAARLMKEIGAKPELYPQVRTLTESGGAKLETLIATTTSSGQHFSVRQVDEIPVPTDFHPPLSAGDPPFPIHYESESVGETAEGESMLSVDQAHCDLNLIFSSDRLEGFGEPSKDSPDTQYGEPMIRKRTISTSLTFLMGSPQFIGNLTGSYLPGADTSSESDERRWLFGRVDATELQPVKADAVENAAPCYYPNIEIYSLDRNAAQRVLVEYRKSGECHAALKQLTDQGEARLEQRLLGIDPPFKFGQSYDLGLLKSLIQIPVEYELTVDGTNRSDSPAPSLFHKIGSAVGYPVAFTSRNEGLNFGIESAALSNGAINVTVTPHYEQSFGNLKVQGAAAQFPPHLVFETHHAATSFSVTPGAYSLVGTLNPPGENGVNDRKDSGRIWLCFVQVNRAKTQ